jgi:hypothetical protein
LTFDTFDNDTAYIELHIENLAGHKFPSGYPARRAFVEFLVLQDNGDTLFKSGVLQPDFNVFGQNATYEPHYDVIRDEQEVQIYEMVMGDVNGDVTTVLERAVASLKDNRLAPLGFTTSHSVYDTTLIVGNALIDDNFNFEGFEGSGTDIIKYHVPLNGHNGTIKVISRVYYQPVPPKWLEEMFSVSTPAIDEFETMYYNADQTPVLVVSDSILGINVVTGVTETTREEFEIYPNPTKNGIVKLKGHDLSKIDEIEIFSLRGKLIQSYRTYPSNGIEISKKAGVYLIKVKSTNSEQVLRVYKTE